MYTWVVQTTYETLKYFFLKKATSATFTVFDKGFRFSKVMVQVDKNFPLPSRMVQDVFHSQPLPLSRFILLFQWPCRVKEKNKGITAGTIKQQIDEAKRHCHISSSFERQKPFDSRPYVFQTMMEGEGRRSSFCL